MKQKRFVKLLMLFNSIITLATTTGSCSRYVDKTTSIKEIPIYQGWLCFYSDSNVLFYKNKVGQQRGIGTEAAYPNPYYIKLPKSLIWWTIGQDSFVFNYQNKQAIAIYMDLFHDKKIKDTSFIPNNIEIASALPHFSVKRDKYDLWNIPMLRNRKHYIIYKGDAIILLYNILPSNYEHFIEATNSFKFL